MKKIIILLIFLMPLFVFAGEISQTVENMLSVPLSSLNADKVVGTPVEIGDKILIPLFEANFGFGGGLGGPGEVFGGGAGGGMEIIPYSLIIVSNDGVQVIPISNKVPFLQQLVEQLPKLIPIIMESLNYFTLQ